MTENISDYPLQGNRSFTLRRGRMTNAQQSAYAELLPTYQVPDGVVAFDALFNRQAPRIIEIGSGMGEATALIAKNHPEADFIAVEVFPPGIGNLARLINEYQLTNLKIVPSDAVNLFLHRIAPQAIDGIHIFFPDPWPKKRHHKRRLIQTPFVNILTKALKPGGYIHCATDWADYAEQMQQVLGDINCLTRLSDEETQNLSMRPTTKFEAKGIAKGHQIVDLIYRINTK